MSNSSQEMISYLETLSYYSMLQMAAILGLEEIMTSDIFLYLDTSSTVCYSSLLYKDERKEDGYDSRVILGVTRDMYLIRKEDGFVPK